MWVFLFFNWYNERFRENGSQSLESILLTLSLCILLALGCSAAV